METDPLTVTELEQANMRLIQELQKKYFGKKLRELNTGSKEVLRRSKLFSLRPFLDERGIIRVGGRLKNASGLDVF